MTWTFSCVCASEPFLSSSRFFSTLDTPPFVWGAGVGSLLATRSLRPTNFSSGFSSAAGSTGPDFRLKYELNDSLTFAVGLIVLNIFNEVGDVGSTFGVIVGLSASKDRS